MMNNQERIEINRDSLKKIVKLRAEAKRDKKRIKELEDGLKGITANIHCLNSGYDFEEDAQELLTDIIVSINLLKKDNHA